MSTKDTDEHKKQYYKDYVDKNKDKLKEKFVCEVCGGKYEYRNITHHTKTSKHIAMQKLKQENDDLKKLLRI